MAIESRGMPIAIAGMALGLVATALVTRWAVGRMAVAAELTKVLGGTHPGVYIGPVATWALTFALGVLFMGMAFWLGLRWGWRVALVTALALPMTLVVFWWFAVEQPLRSAFG
ncbi:MAG: hypothetical protein IBX63_08700 [Coriobacteriia bacterium]|nr:hypothetical protein [Coriobacteriia bacterium]